RDLGDLGEALAAPPERGARDGRCSEAHAEFLDRAHFAAHNLSCDMPEIDPVRWQRSPDVDQQLGRIMPPRAEHVAGPDERAPSIEELTSGAARAEDACVEPDVPRGPRREWVPRREDELEALAGGDPPGGPMDELVGVGGVALAVIVGPGVRFAAEAH